jgi:hypothetical protein
MAMILCPAPTAVKHVALGRVKEARRSQSQRRGGRKMSHPTLATGKAKPISPPLKREPNEMAARPLGRVLSSRQFWDLMERWRVPDAMSLELIEFAGKLGKNGKRPRFRFTTRQQRITSYLPEIDAALTAAGKDQNWLHRKIEAAPFTRRSPIGHMLARGTVGMADVLQRLNREAMRAALTK